MYYFYDGTFLGFLSLVYQIFLNKNFDIIILKNSSNTLFQGTYVETSFENAEKVYKRLENTLGKENLEKIYSTFLSEENGIELVLLNYINSGLKLGKTITKHFLPEVNKVENLCKRVNHEAHKFKGMLRFRKLLDDTYFAIIKPDYDVIPIITPHFIDRYNDQNFVIYDEKRKKALIFDSYTKKSKITAIEEFDQRLKNYDNHELLHKEEKEYIALWKKYFDSIGIEDRKNTKLQKSHMSSKYWDNLVETN